MVDGGTDGTAQELRARFPDVQVLEQAERLGPGPARMAGIRASQADWVAVLDDDDELLPTACSDMLRLVAQHGPGKHSVFHFAHGNGWLAQEFRVMALEDYLQGRIRGDFVPLLRRADFLSRGHAYPLLRIGGEGLLWLDVGRQEGIPTWRHKVGVVHGDAPSRLTSARNQVHRAAEYADFQDLFIQRFGDDLRRLRPRAYRKRLLAAGIYSAMAGRTTAARRRAHDLRASGFALAGAAVALAAATPALARLSFRAYRRAERAWRGTEGE